MAASNGTLTPTPDGLLLYETSGRERQGGFVQGSGTLWELNPAEPTVPQPVATGLKNAYAHVFDRDGLLWSTEIAEPTGGTAAPDELNRIERGADYGWPACVGDRQPVASFGGDHERCRDTVRPVAQFGPGATATSVAVNPFAAGELIVTLWVRPGARVHPRGQRDAEFGGRYESASALVGSRPTLVNCAINAASNSGSALSG